jgi:hypothetical protein
MKRTAGILLVGIAVIGAAALGNALDSSAGTGPATIRITDRQVTLERVDIGRRGRSPGDVEVQNTLVYNRRITRRALGHAEFVCTYTVGINRNCRGTVFLPKGKLVVGGSLRYRHFYELAVLGGTGLYDNARGTVTITRLGTHPTRTLLYFRLVG